MDATNTTNGATTMSKLTGRIEKTLGFVMVYTTSTDCDGVQRSIACRRSSFGSNVIVGNPLYHWVDKHLVKEAMAVARKSVKTGLPAVV